MKRWATEYRRRDGVELLHNLRRTSTTSIDETRDKPQCGVAQRAFHTVDEGRYGIRVSPADATESWKRSPSTRPERAASSK